MIARLGRYLGRQTNNVAEYEGLLLGLKHARELGYREVEVRADGMIAVSDAPGTGYQVREDLVQKFTVREETFRAGK